MPAPSGERVNHPAYYGREDSPYEAIKVIESMGIGYQFCLGNVVKYVMRAGRKTDDPVEDLDKGKWYLDRAVYNWRLREAVSLEERKYRRDRGFPVNSGRGESA